jgi:hypothetical protein
MRNLKKLCAASVLTLALALSASAGEMPTGVTAPPPTQRASAQGEMPTGIAGEMPTGITAADPATEILLNLLQSLLSLF